MAQIRKKTNLLRQAILENDWTLYASASNLILLAMLIAPFLVTSYTVANIVKLLQPLGFFLAIFFALLAFLKFVLSRAAQKNSFDDVPILDKELTSEEVEEVLTKLPPSKIKLQKNKPAEWSLTLIQNLPSKRFEALCLAIYAEKGIRTQLTKLTAGESIYIELYQDNANHKPTALAQSKAWKEAVDVKPITNFIAMMSYKKIAKGFYLTPRGYTEKAKLAAKHYNLTLFNGDMILMMIQRLPKPAQDKLLATFCSN